MRFFKRVWKITNGQILGNKNLTQKLLSTFLGDVNFMSVDWDWKSLGISNMNYWTAVKTVKLVGDHFGDFIHFLVQNTETTTDKFHLVGHSLGAHVAARAGHRLNGTLGRLTGLGKKEVFHEAQ